MAALALEDRRSTHVKKDGIELQRKQHMKIYPPQAILDGAPCNWSFFCLKPNCSLHMIWQSKRSVAGRHTSMQSANECRSTSCRLSVNISVHSNPPKSLRIWGQSRAAWEKQIKIRLMSLSFCFHFMFLAYSGNFVSLSIHVLSSCALLELQCLLQH